MLFADGIGGLILLGLWIFCLIDVITADSADIRNLPKAAWLIIVLILPDIGSIIWLVAGHPWQADSRLGARTGSGAVYPEYDRPGRHVPTNPDDDEVFLTQVRERAQAQRRDYEARRKAELQAEEERLLRRRDEDGSTR